MLLAWLWHRIYTNFGKLNEFLIFKPFGINLKIRKVWRKKISQSKNYILNDFNLERGTKNKNFVIQTWKMYQIWHFSPPWNWFEFKHCRRLSKPLCVARNGIVALALKKKKIHLIFLASSQRVQQHHHQMHIFPVGRSICLVGYSKTELI